VSEYLIFLAVVTRVQLSLGKSEFATFSRAFHKIHFGGLKTRYVFSCRKVNSGDICVIRSAGGIMKIIGIFLLGLSITGCTTAKVWYKPGVSDLTYKQDRFRCMSATGHTELSPLDAAALGAAAASSPVNPVYMQNQMARREMFTACMEALGYEQLPEDEVAALKKTKLNDSNFYP